jgi:hypothetical protein
MSSPSNLYAEKVFAEHPLALWSLDDAVDYLSLITESQREILEPSWSIENVSDYYEGIITGPFPISITNTIEGMPNETVLLKSPELVSLQSLQERLRTMCIGTYYYSNSDNYDYIEIGYEYTDSETSLLVEHVKRFTSITQDRWSFISSTFELPSETNPFRVIIRIKLNDNGSAPSDYVFSFNGLSVGQWSEEFNATSLGSNAISLPSNIGIPFSGLKCIESNSYGSNLNKGYYIVSNNVLTAKNTSIPLVYGSSGVIRILPNYSTVVESVVDAGTPSTTTLSIIDGGVPSSEPLDSIDGGLVYLSPSYIVPGLGFLNNDGRYKDYTLEFWSRIDCNSSESHRLVGPIGSQDGLYVEGGHITLVINNSFRSYFVGQWIRPMLFHISISKNSATVLLNGEEVISMPISSESLLLPNKLSDEGKDQDYIGFYSYPDIPSFEIDSVAIYSYLVPTIVAKRRYVYGQGVGSSEPINNSYAGTEAFVDYAFSEYTADYNYPDFAKWNQGSFDNIITQNQSLKTPEYQLPTIYFDDKTIEDLYEDCKSIQTVDDKFITLKPNESWNSTTSYLNFARLDILQTPVNMIYGVVSIKENSNNETIFRIYNSTNSDSLSIVKTGGGQINYVFNFNNQSTILKTFGYVVDQKIVLGIKINELSQSVPNISSFFNNLSTLKMYVGGSGSLGSVFSGKIFNVGFGTHDNSSKFSYFTNGFTDHLQYQYFIDNLASYTLLPTSKYGSFFLDIGVSGYWEDYMPLSYFAKYISNEYGQTYYDLDFLQFNLDYPAPSAAVTYETVSEWIYEELDDEFSHPVQQTYQNLDNDNYTGWKNYQDLNERSSKYKKYDISESDVKAYITMQYILDGANLLQNNFTTISQVDENRVIDFSNHPNWTSHKFEVVDGTIIYPPAKIDFNKLAIVYRLEFNSRSTINKPISIKSLQLSSQSFDHNRFNKVGTRFGSGLYPYVKSGIYFDFKTKNPFAIGKTSMPYLYATQNTGIEVRNENEPELDKGVSLIINTGQSPNFRVSAMQLWIRANKTSFPAVRKKFFEINYLSDSIEFFIEANSGEGDRGRIFAVSKNTQAPFSGITYYINGQFVREPVISIKEWSVLGLAFENNLNFDNFLGSLNINGQYTFNNISYYQATNLQLAQSRTLRSWSKVKTVSSIDQDWEDWLSYTWNQILVLGTSDLYGTNPSDIYKTYIGTNKIIIDDDNGLSLTPEAIKIYQDSTWQSFIVTPV